MYVENYKTLMQETKENLKLQKPTMFKKGRLRIVKISILPKLINKFKAIPTKIPAGLFVDIDKPILKCKWKRKGARIAKTMLKRKNKIGGITVLTLKTYYKTTETKSIQT